LDFVGSTMPNNNSRKLNRMIQKKKSYLKLWLQTISRMTTMITLVMWLITKNCQEEQKVS